MGQGYADVLLPPGGGGWLWGGAGGQQPPPPPPLNNWHDRGVDVDNANIPQQPTVEVSEEQVGRNCCFQSLNHLRVRLWQM